LARCLESAAAQDFENFEHIVVDDGSSDGSEYTIREASVRDDRIVYLRHDDNSGLPAVRTNEGILHARGEAVAFLFDDNILQPNFISAAWGALQRSGADVVYANVHMVTRDGNDFALGGWPLTLELLRNLNTIPNGGVLVRRSFFERYGLYDPHIIMRRICDWDLWLRALSLGAKFCHLEQEAAIEYGLRSPNSLGNTIAWSVKVACAYMLDEARFADRSGRLTPQMIGGYDVLDPAPVLRYVRNAHEWSELVRTVYVPFVERHGPKGYDPTLPGNRAAAIDPRLGWNAEWSLINDRRRYLVVSNSINAWASLWVDALGQQLGAIVLNCPEWQLSSFSPEDIDLLVLLDCTASFLKPLLEAFQGASVPVIYAIGYGEQRINYVPAPISQRHFTTNGHITGLLGRDFYFPQVGASFDSAQRECAKALATDGYAVLADARVADQWRLANCIPFPSAAPAVPVSTPTLGASTIAYQESAAVSIDADEIIVSPETVSERRGETIVRSSWESLSALVETRPRSRVVVDRSILDAAPVVERAGLAAILKRSASTLIGQDDAELEDAAEPDSWRDWIDNLSRCSQLGRLIAQASAIPARRPRVGVFLNSEMFSGSEVYGLELAYALQLVGGCIRVLVPDESDYGQDSDPGPLTGWLLEHGLPPAAKAPYRAGAAYLAMTEPDRLVCLARLDAFLGAQSFDVLICAGFMPLFADLPNGRGLVFMALFQPSAYDQKEIAYLRGRISGIMSDSRWSLAAHSTLVTAPGAVVRAMMPLKPGTPAVIEGRGATIGAIRIAVGGTLQPRKRQLEAIKAAALLREEGLPVCLNLYGYRLAMLESYVRELDDLVAALNLGAVVTLHGFVGSEVIAKNNDIVLSASVDESLPQTLIELMGAGLVGVAGLCGGIDELITDGDTGYLTADLSPRGLADVVRRAIRGQDRWPAIVANARAMIAREYSIATNTTSLLDLLIRGAQTESTPFGRLSRRS
jgi:hypothetical protein